MCPNSVVGLSPSFSGAPHGHDRATPVSWPPVSRHCRFRYVQCGGGLTDRHPRLPRVPDRHVESNGAALKQPIIHLTYQQAADDLSTIDWQEPVTPTTYSHETKENR